eukprot:SAG25_NODE_11105_length_313_cov_1.191589_1_plen_25_part_10
MALAFGRAARALEAAAAAYRIDSVC